MNLSKPGYRTNLNTKRQMRHVKRKLAELIKGAASNVSRTHGWYQAMEAFLDHEFDKKALGAGCDSLSPYADEFARLPSRSG